MIRKNLSSYILAICLVAAFYSCSEKEMPESVSEVVSDCSFKIVNTPEYSDPSSILLSFDNAPGQAVVDSLSRCGVVKLERLFDSVSGNESEERRFNLDKWYVATLASGCEAKDVAKSIAAVPAVRLVEYDIQFSKASDGVVYPYEPELGPVTRATVGSSAVFNDPSLGDQWNYMNGGKKTVSQTCYAGADINVNDVWSTLTAGDNSVIVAVVDEGVKYDHPDLAANMWTDASGKHGYNFVDAGGEITWNKAVYDDAGNLIGGDSGHGTHCAGTIAAVNNNGLGVCGVAGGSGKGDGVKIMSCQIFSGGRGGTASIAGRAIKYAADNGASVISCSFGYKGGAYLSDGAYKAKAGAEYDALRYFESKKNNKAVGGGIVVFASGNDGLPYATYPGALADVISVSAFGPDFLPAYYTNYGPGCNITAPGGEAYHKTAAGSVTRKSMILSTVPSELYGSDYGYMQGTSMACPHVAGVVALGISYALKLGKEFNLSDFKQMIVTSTNDFETRLSSVGKKTLADGTTLDLYKYRNQMGEGSIDAWDLMMKIEGIPSIVVKNGEGQYVDVSSYFGTASVNLTYLSVEVLGNGKESMGLTEDPYMKYGKLYIHPTKTGACKVRITAVGGGTELGGEDKIGGMKVSQDISIVSRGFMTSNGGWL